MTLNLLVVAIKLALGLLALVVVINLTGKGNLAPTSASDQVQNYVLGGVIGGVINNPSISILQFLLIIMIWLALILSFKWLKTHNQVIKKAIDGDPTDLISRGIIDVEATRAAGLTAQDLAFKLRSQNIYSIKKVKRAVLEQNGSLNTIVYGEENPKYPLITDGHIQYKTLESIDKTEEWLAEHLVRAGYDDASKIFLAEYIDGNITIVEY